MRASAHTLVFVDVHCTVRVLVDDDVAALVARRAAERRATACVEHVPELYDAWVYSAGVVIDRALVHDVATLAPTSFWARATRAPTLVLVSRTVADGRSLADCPPRVTARYRRAIEAAVAVATTTYGLVVATRPSHVLLGSYPPCVYFVDFSAVATDDDDVVATLYAQPRVVDSSAARTHASTVLGALAAPERRAGTLVAVDDDDDDDDLSTYCYCARRFRPWRTNKRQRRVRECAWRRTHEAYARAVFCHFVDDGDAVSATTTTTSGCVACGSALVGTFTAHVRHCERLRDVLDAVRRALTRRDRL